MDHPKPAVLRRFLHGTTSKSENREVVRHLLRRCEACSTALRGSGGASALLVVDCERALKSFLKEAAEQAAAL
jgi:hypothetical protein